MIEITLTVNDKRLILSNICKQWTNRVEVVQDGRRPHHLQLRHLETQVLSIHDVNSLLYFHTAAVHVPRGRLRGSLLMMVLLVNINTLFDHTLMGIVDLIVVVQARNKGAFVAVVTTDKMRIATCEQTWSNYINYSSGFSSMKM